MYWYKKIIVYIKKKCVYYVRYEMKMQAIILFSNRWNFVCKVSVITIGFNIDFLHIW